ncbi:MAG: hypothetical protein A2445_04390 [Candidatus Jacksonbacteria bacterium RIFOXYC2_FULL_44_29]|nr:MAG: hypothetical protein UW45_C0011G0006 [Parcubacteria group bacterium GW2011_GWC2_44_22]OGY76856.1 MAG: hypothetical protein A2240_04775 [Candidatus Jacksonbacteria bacterium RIFOXYA2_FULL_43_12]OGY77625.1 MAG: hypothetical protein A2445_04390 [Candidatus Jacksonbacteria bacterium RIFOXYC2_FULL_44_29]OGY80291.1 MAG: hypothetical protein A2550_04045 [Candidatus Jacksonbacteria bacterium RIFOXYD2_FULL_43_21]HBH45798.1 hypothetical protein [Candidatus Jacksonbacteria bacterium]
MVKLSRAKKGKANFNRQLIKYFKLIAVLTLILASTMSYVFFIRPNRTKTTNNLDRETERIEQDIAIKEKQLTILAGRISGFEMLQRESVGVMREMLPVVGEEHQLFMLLQDVAATEGLHITGFSLGVPVAVPLSDGVMSGTELPVVKVPVTLQLSGGTLNYEKTKDLLARLYNKYRIFELSSLDIMSLMPASGNITLHFDVYFVGVDATEVILPGTTAASSTKK